MSSPGRHPSGRRCGDPFTIALVLLAMPYALARLAIDTARGTSPGRHRENRNRLMGWFGFGENKPKTGSGTAQPKGTRTTGKVKVTYRKPDGTKIQPVKKKK